MSEPWDVTQLMPASWQAYGTVGASIVLGLIGVAGYFKKVNAQDVAAKPFESVAEPFLRDITKLLQIMADAAVSSARDTKLIAEFNASRQRQDEIDRAYQRGRDEALDKATALVAKNLRES